jgi:hypothetical protein
MNGCEAMQARFTEYLDGWLNGREMQHDRRPPEKCRNCSQEWESLRQAQAALAELGAGCRSPKTCCCGFAWRSARSGRASRQGLFQGWNLAWKNTVGPFLLQASAGFASAVLLLGTVIVLLTMFAQPETAQASTDEPLGNPTAPRLVSLSTGAGNNEIGDLSGPVVVEAYINGAGQIYDYRIVSGPDRRGDPLPGGEPAADQRV